MSSLLRINNDGSSRYERFMRCISNANMPQEILMKLYLVLEIFEN